MKYFIYCFYRIVKGNNGSAPYLSAYIAVSSLNYMHFLVLLTLIEGIVGIDIMPRNLNKIGIVISALPILILDYYLFFYKKKYLEIISKYEKSNKTKNPNLIVIGYIVATFFLLIATKELFFRL
ncbi:hypothetical protein [Chondrinema litorale]|uniref:hypothetical protein n=1 Tax=Chondrinema litorale TaxID=2994555 RepID=UPI00254349EF|nr:hypothetical protein [Chondrinema litorale]UZR99940.1 hypothetical protein OQ292_39305 [Chondrinema litorale]